MADSREIMTKEEAITILHTELKYTVIDADYAHDAADGKVELVSGQDIASALTMAIAALNEQGERRWIPVTERLPEIWKDVLLYDAINKEIKWGCMCEDCWLGVRMNGKVTHWRLVEPPKGE